MRLKFLLIVGSEHIGRSNVAFSNKSYLILSKVCLSYLRVCLDFHDYSRDENRGGKVVINKNSSAADDRQLAADRARPISVDFSTSLAMHCG